MNESVYGEWLYLDEAAPAPGAWNMAVDDYLFRTLTSIPRTVLRFYRWKRPTASLGYSQRINKVIDIEYCRLNGIDVVRRMTGGKLVLHDREVTYSITSSDKSLFGSTVLDSYRKISEGLMCGLKRMGLHAYLAEKAPSEYIHGNLPCFSYPSRHEVEVSGRKVIGSAQKREGGKFMQHGSIPLQDDDERLRAVSLLTDEDPSEIRMLPLSQAVGGSVDFSWVVETLKAGIIDFFKVELKPFKLAARELEEIDKILKERYGSEGWTYLR